MTNGWLQLAQEALKLPGLLLEIYGDLAKPGVQQVGKALGTVLGLGNTVLWPIQLANERSRMNLEKNLEEFRKQMEGVPIEKIIPVSPEIGVPIAEKLSYVNDLNLSELYITLLAKASNSETVWEAHPSFVNVINNISPDEAKLLEFFSENNDLEFVSAIWENTAKTFIIGGEFLFRPEVSTPLIFPKNIAAYFSNLSGLGLIIVHYDRAVHNSSVYPILESYWKPMFPPEASPLPDGTIRFKRGVITRTNFGLQFIHACHAK